MDITISILGPAYNGKSSLCKAIIGEMFDEYYTHTNGVDCFKKEIDKDIEGIELDYSFVQKINIIMYDIGLEKFGKYYIDRSDILIFCYSYDNYDIIIDFLKKYNNPDKTCILVETKKDLRNNLFGLIYPSEFAENYFYVETSSKSGEGINKLIEIIKLQIKAKQPIKIREQIIPDYENKTCCCVIN